MTMRKLFFGVGLIVLLAGIGCSRGGARGADGGVFKSSDAGASWSQAVAVLSARGVGSAAGANILSLVADPSDPFTLYAGTEGQGLIFSYDGAASWQQPREGVLRTGAVTAVAVDPTEKCRVYVAKSDRIFRTDDCNRTFGEEIYVEGKAGVFVTGLAVDWFSGESVYAALSDGRLLKTSDYGANWTTVFRGRQAITRLLISNLDSRVVVLGMLGGGFARSTDGGLTWAPILDQLKPYRDANRVFGLVQDAQGERMMAATGYGVLTSEDQGDSWRPLKLLSAPGEVMVNAVGIDPAEKDHMLYAVGNALYETRDAGEHWAVQKLATSRLIRTILFDSSNSETIYIGMRAVQQ